MNITDETVWTADAAYWGCAGSHGREPRLCRTRAATEAAAPLIAAQALRSAVKIVMAKSDECAKRGDPDSLAVAAGGYAAADVLVVMARGHENAP